MQVSARHAKWELDLEAIMKYFFARAFGYLFEYISNVRYLFL